jgi:ADP-heptose:LPS heptosyltransferase
MHTITIANDPIAFDDVLLKPGNYWAEDHNAAGVLHEGGGYGGVSLYRTTPPIPAFITENADITVVRVGGFGDLLWMNAIYDALHAKYPGLTITHACLPRYAPVLLGYADRVVSYPLAEPKQDQKHHVWWLENIIESRACRGTEHPCDRIAARFGLDPLPRKSAYHLSDKERKWARDRLRAFHKKQPDKGKTDRLRIGVHLGGSGIYKIKSYQQIGKVMAALTSPFLSPCELITVGDPIEPGLSVNVPANVYHCPTHRHTIRESIAMISTCDVILAPDSVFTHVGAALDIPVVGLYGPFDGAAYMQGQRGEAIQGKLRCSPCSHHLRNNHMPPAGPCAKTGFCNAMEGSPNKAGELEGGFDVAEIVKKTLHWAQIGREGRRE